MCEDVPHVVSLDFSVFITAGLSLARLGYVAEDRWRKGQLDGEEGCSELVHNAVKT